MFGSSMINGHVSKEQPSIPQTLIHYSTGDAWLVDLDAHTLWSTWS